MKILLDTNICIYIINAKPAHVIKRFRSYDMGEVGVSAITASELAFGVEKSGSQRNRMALENFLAPLTVAPVDESVIWHYARTRIALEQAGTPIGALDTLIAAHALALNARLVTNNVREFSRVNGLMIDNWVQADRHA